MDNSNFEILINDTFVRIIPEKDSELFNNEYLLSLINDFENGKWRYEIFQRYIWDRIKYTALSKDERDKLIDNPSSTLEQSAKNLRKTNNPKYSDGELAEILLYGIMKDHYKALSVVPKIFYKQSIGDYAKGADSVHIVIKDKDNFSLWFGEAKFYTDITKAIQEAISSIKNFLTDNDGEKIRKENSIITSLNELDSDQFKGLQPDEALTLIKKIQTTLNDNTSLDKIKPIINIPILLLYECEITANQEILTEDYKKDIIKFHKNKATVYFEKQAKKLSSISMYSKITFHLILFPVPNKKNIVDKFSGKAKAYSS